MSTAGGPSRGDESSADHVTDRSHRRSFVVGGFVLACVLLVLVGIIVGRHFTSSSPSLAAFSDDPLVTCDGAADPVRASLVSDRNGCHDETVFEPDLSPVDIVVDPRHPITPSSTELHLFVQEVGCNGGAVTSRSRIIGPQVHTDANRIAVSAAAKPRHGFQTCQGAIGGDLPTGAEITVSLDGPVGRRPVLDATRYPYEPVATYHR